MSNGSQMACFPSLCSGSSFQYQYSVCPPLPLTGSREICADPSIGYPGKAPAPKCDMFQSLTYPDNGSGPQVPPHPGLQGTLLCQPPDFETCYSLPAGQRPLTWEDPLSGSKTMAAAEQSLTSDLYNYSISRHGAYQWKSADDSKGGFFYFASGFTPPTDAFGSPLPPCLPTSPQYLPEAQDLRAMPPHFSQVSPDSYSAWAQEATKGISLRQMRAEARKKMTRKTKNQHSITRKNGSASDTSPMPNKPSKYFSNRGIFMFLPPQSCGPYPGMHTISIADRYILCQKVLCQRLAEIDLPTKVSCVYNPLEYAFETHYKFVKKFYNSNKRVLFLAMNPGPFGMSQNGVPFGECSIVRDWMQIEGKVQKPTVEHPKRPIKGMGCGRSEISAARFWQLFCRLCPTPVSFFSNCAIHNLCPLTFMTGTGRNLGPSDMPVKVSRQLSFLCGLSFLEVVSLFQTDHVIAVGKYAYTFAQLALPGDKLCHVTLHCMMHPSPANPSANKGWASIAERQLRQFGVYDIIVSSSPHPEQHPSSTQQNNHPPPPDPPLVLPPHGLQTQVQQMQLPQQFDPKPQQQHQSVQHVPHPVTYDRLPETPETPTAQVQKSHLQLFNGSRLY